MFLRLLCLNFLAFLFSYSAAAQTFLTGKIYEGTTDSLIPGVNIYNSTGRFTSRSGPSGTYSIQAKEGDKITFSAAGFNTEIITVKYDMLLIEYNVTLVRQVITLKPVTVYGGYRSDSLERRNYYADIYKKQPGITGGNRPSNGVGVSISPLSFFSYRAKQKRNLRKKLINDEQEYYIDFMFPADWVENLTGLHGDSLRLFMYKYRPSYSFCRKTNREGMLMYVNEKVKEFRRAKAKN